MNLSGTSFYYKVYKLLAGFLFGIVLVLFGLSLFVARMAVYPWWYNRDLLGQDLAPCSDYQKRAGLYCGDPLQDLKLEYSSFDHELRSGEKTITVKGWWVPATSKPMGTVLLIHGAGNDRRELMKHVPYLHAAGFDVLLIDCWNHGLNAGDGRGQSFGLWESVSALAAIDWAVHKRLPTPLVAMGVSTGAFTALKVASDSGAVAGVIAESSYVSASRVLLEFPLLDWVPNFSKKLALGFLTLWLKSPVTDLDVHRFGKRVQKPVLLIHGDADTTINVAHSKEIFDVLASQRKELWVVPFGKHDLLWNSKKEDYEKHVLSFLETVKQQSVTTR